jgi:prevent-host-death family protein
MPAEIGAYDAKTHLPELLRKVRRGHRFTITHRGKPIAELIPAGGAAREDFDAAVDDMLNFERIKDIDPADINAWIAEGRR